MTTSRTGAAKKRAKKKTAGSGTTAKSRAAPKAKAASSKPTVRSAKLSAPRRVTAEERLRLIREAAFFRAEQRGFRNGSPVEDWLKAEQEIDEAIGKQD